MKKVAARTYTEVVLRAFCIVKSNQDPQEKKYQECKKNSPVAYRIKNRECAHDGCKDAQRSPRFKNGNQFIGQGHLRSKHLSVEARRVFWKKYSHRASDEMVGGKNEQIQVSEKVPEFHGIMIA